LNFLVFPEDFLPPSALPQLSFNSFIINLEKSLLAILHNL
jgi:hypothetical protein